MLMVAMLLAAIEPGVAPASNPLAPALAGKLECAQPVAARKTCRSLTRYTSIDGSTYSTKATILLSPNGPVVFENTVISTVKGANVCGSITPENIKTGTIRVAGKALTEVEAAPMRARIALAMASVMNKEICARYEMTPDGLVERATVDGVYQPKGDERVDWVDPADGYQVAP